MRRFLKISHNYFLPHIFEVVIENHPVINEGMEYSACVRTGDFQI
jgi:hypothetical protein